MASDNFNRADAADFGANWTASTLGTMSVNSNTARGVAGLVRGNFYTAETFDSDQFSEVEVAEVVGSGEWIGVGVRGQSSGGDIGDTYLAIYFNDTGTHRLQLYKFDGGSFTQLGSNVDLAGPLSAGTKLRLSIVGQTLTFSTDGTPQITQDDSTFGPSLPQPPRPGVFTYGNVNLDNWSGGSVVDDPIVVVTSSNSRQRALAARLGRKRRRR